MEAEPTWSIELPLCPEAKGNVHKLTGKRIYNTGKGARFLLDAVTLMRAKGNGPFSTKDKLSLWVQIRYPNYRRDVDVELIKDALEKAYIIPNDRQIRKIDVEAEDEIGEPRIRLRLTRIGELPWVSKSKKRTSGKQP